MIKTAAQHIISYPDLTLFYTEKQLPDLHSVGRGRSEYEITQHSHHGF